VSKSAALIFICVFSVVLATGRPYLRPQAPAQPPSASGLAVVVLDPAHGGADSGARGATGLQEKEIVLALAWQLAAQLERQDLQVVWTRRGDENPSFDERAAAANAQRGAVFISLHVGSTGIPGTARAYYLTFEENAASPQEAARPLRWERAQFPFAGQSRKLAELVQVNIGQKLRGSHEVPLEAPLRQLRSVAAPAIAVELASVSVADRKTLEAAIPALAEAIAGGVAAYRPLFTAVNF
jgi:N-acetylmuramoyl-L-alanine amidase